MSLELQQAIQSYENYISDNGIDESVIDAMIESAYVFVEQQEFAESKNANQQNNNVQAGPSPFGNMPTDSEGFMNIPDGIDEELPFN